MKYVVHGSFENPSKARNYACFSSPDFTDRQTAEVELQLWKMTRTYTYQWVEEVK